MSNNKVNGQTHIGNRKNKLSVWMKKIIQSNVKDTEPAASIISQGRRPTKSHNKQSQSQKVDVPMDMESFYSAGSDTNTINSSLQPIFNRDNSVRSFTSEKELKLQWDEEQLLKTNYDPTQQMQPPLPQQLQDNASVAPIISFCSSSVKSATFSDLHSVQSTRPTVMSTRTFETNSSTVAIPPASIIDRARPNNSSSYMSRPPSSRHVSLQRHNSSHTVNSIITIKS